MGGGALKAGVVAGGGWLWSCASGSGYAHDAPRPRFKQDWQGNTSLHLVFPVWHATHARRTEGALGFLGVSEGVPEDCWDWTCWMFCCCWISREASISSVGMADISGRADGRRGGRGRAEGKEINLPIKHGLGLCQHITALYNPEPVPTLTLSSTYYHGRLCLHFRPCSPRPDTSASSPLCRPIQPRRDH